MVINNYQHSPYGMELSPNTKQESGKENILEPTNTKKDSFIMSSSAKELLNQNTTVTEETTNINNINGEIKPFNFEEYLKEKCPEANIIKLSSDNPPANIHNRNPKGVNFYISESALQKMENDPDFAKKTIDDILNMFQPYHKKLEEEQGKITIFNANFFIPSNPKKLQYSMTGQSFPKDMKIVDNSSTNIKEEIIHKKQKKHSTEEISNTKDNINTYNTEKNNNKKEYWAYNKYASQNEDNEPKIQVRKANGDIIDLSTGRVIKKA